MRVHELIYQLAKLPADAEVAIHYDGGLRISASRVWLTRDGRVGIAESDEPIYHTEDRPANAPQAKDDPYWSTSNVDA